MNSSLISIVTDLEKRSYAETGLCREYYNGKSQCSLGRDAIRPTGQLGLVIIPLSYEQMRTRTTFSRK